MIQDKSENYEPPDFTQYVGLSIPKFDISLEKPPFSDQNVLDLLLLGVQQTRIIWESLHGTPRYFLDRTCAKDVLDELDAGNRTIVIHSELGNGKTLLLEGIKCRSLEKGYDVYTVSLRTDNLFRELDQVLQSSYRILIIIDDYADWFDVIEYISIHANTSTSLLLSSRSSVHDVMVDRLSEVMGIENFPEIAVDRLSDADVDWVRDFFDEYVLWAEKAAWSKKRKSSFIRDRCGGRFYGILIMVLESPQIASRFDYILGQLNNKRSYYDVIITILVLTVLHHETSLNTLVDIWGRSILDSGFRRNQSVRELIDTHAGEIRLRSAVAAEFVLKNVANVNLTVDTLISVARAADKAGSVSTSYRSLLTKLMRFNSVQRILPDKQKRRAIIRYYEGIKNLYGCRRNPQFWLQYAIACLVIEEFERAERYFRTAYSLAESRNQNTYQIDNHYARFLLLTAVESGNEAKCMTSFRKARLIINEQIKEERMHYPFRVAQLYTDFFEAFQRKLEPAQVEEIVNAADFVRKRIESLPDERRRHRNVSDCYSPYHTFL